MIKSDICRVAASRLTVGLSAHLAQVSVLTFLSSRQMSSSVSRFLDYFAKSIGNLAWFCSPLTELSRVRRVSAHIGAYILWA